MYTDKIWDFLTEIQVQLKKEKLSEADCFVPGLSIKSGTILVDSDKLKYVGDLLHEAGHLAVVSSEERKCLNGTDIEHRPQKDGEEIASLLWSYLAAKHLDVPMSVVFHNHGYRGESKWLIEMFESENYIGAPLLEWMGIIDWNQMSNKPIVRNWLRA
jgi:hypothetical protein